MRGGSLEAAEHSLSAGPLAAAKEVARVHRRLRGPLTREALGTMFVKMIMKTVFKIMFNRGTTLAAEPVHRQR